MTNITTDQAIKFWNYLFTTPWLRGFTEAHRGDLRDLRDGLGSLVDIKTFYPEEPGSREAVAAFLREIAEAIEAQHKGGTK